MSLFSSILKDMFVTPEVVGRHGENLAAAKLGWINFLGYHGKILQNIYVPKPDGSSTEIDLLYITTKGIFVIESKNYAGFIFGDEANPKWTTTLYSGKTWYGKKQVEKHQFYNPIWQNRTHIKHIRNFIKAYDIPFVSIIVFSDHCELKSITIDSADVFVSKRSEMNSIIRGVWNYCPEILSKEYVTQIYNKLLPLTNMDHANKQAHIDSINRKLDSTEICPWCGAALILRTSKQGSHIGNRFYGCSNYPKCKYTKIC